MPFARRRRALSAFVALALLGLALAGCERPDASHVTSPSARALIGVTTGNVSYMPEGEAPPDVASPEGWNLRLENVRFSALENGMPALQVVSQIQAGDGPALELWLTDDTDTPWLRWSGGSARSYEGVVCFQLRLQDAGDALHLDTAKTYQFTMAFRDPGTDQVVTSKTITVAGRVPTPSGLDPGEGSGVARELLGCPRSVI